VGLVGLTCAVAWTGFGGLAGAKGLDTEGARGGLTQLGSAYRYEALTPTHPKPGGRWTVVERIDRRDGAISRWWRLGGSWLLPAVAYDRSGAGLSGDGERLILSQFRYAYPRPGKWSTRFAVLDTGPHPRFRPGTGSTPPSRLPVRRYSLHGDFSLAAVSPDGATAYLYHYPRAGYPGAYQVVAFDTSSGRLRPGVLLDTRRQGHRLEGTPATSLTTRRWTYTLFGAGLGGPYLLAVDSFSGHVRTVPLPQLKPYRNLFMLKLRLGGDGAVVVRGRPPQLERKVPLLRIDRAGFTVRATRALAESNRAERFLAFARTPRFPGNVLGRTATVGRSAGGRPIRLKQLGDPRLGGKVLVFACVHGDECAARHIEPLRGGCPDPGANVFIVPDLDPDGLAEGTRLNADGVDLNRNFSVDWRRIGAPGDSEYSGPHAFSEPESRLAATIVRRVAPAVTIWFHQHHGPHPYVRAWGHSAPAGRRLARLAGIPFRLMRWMDGTAPNWQNRRFPQSSAYVVELPWGGLSPALEGRLANAIDGVARREARVGED
jgi:protein MpaA